MEHYLNDYIFSADWFSTKIKEWEIQLAHLKDKPARCLEIGSFEGRSAIWLHDNICTHDDASMLLVEPGYSGVSDILKQNIMMTGTDKISIHPIDSTDLAHDILRITNNMEELFDYIYIDGRHTSHGTLEDAVVCFKMLAPGGRMCFDDYEWPYLSSDGTKPKLAIDAFLECYATKIKVLHIGDQVWIQKL